MSDSIHAPLALSPLQRGALAQLLPLFAPPIPLAGHTALVSPSDCVVSLRDWRTSPRAVAERTEALNAFFKACQMEPAAHFYTIHSFACGDFRKHPEPGKWSPFREETIYGLALVAGQMGDLQYLGSLCHEFHCPAEVVDFIVRNQQFSRIHADALNSEPCSREIAKAVLLGEVPGCDPGAAIYTRAFSFQEIRSLIEEAPRGTISQRLGGDLKDAIPLLAGRADAPVEFLREVAPAIAKLEGKTPPEHSAIESLTKNANAPTLADFLAHATNNLALLHAAPRAKELTTEQILRCPQISGPGAPPEMRYLGSDALFSKAKAGVTHLLPCGPKLATGPGAAISGSLTGTVAVEIDSFRIEVEHAPRNQSRLSNTTVYLLGSVKGTERRVCFDSHRLHPDSLLGFASSVARAVDENGLKQGSLGI